MTFNVHQEILDALPGFYDVFGFSATYRPSGGLLRSITYIPESQDPAAQDPYPPGDTKIIRVMSSEVASPGLGDEFTLNDDNTWYFLAVSGDSSEYGEWVLELTRSERRRV